MKTTSLLLIALDFSLANAAQVSISSILAAGGNPFVGNVTTSQISCTLADGTTTTCMRVASIAMANHAMGPYCDGGNWNNSVVNYAAYATDCTNQNNYSSCSSSDPFCLRCLECPPKSSPLSYLIPLIPKLTTATALVTGGDNNYGDAVAINGIPLTKADPIALLASQNNPAPLDWGKLFSKHRWWTCFTSKRLSLPCDSSSYPSSSIWRESGVEPFISFVVGCGSQWPPFNTYWMGIRWSSDLRSLY